MLNFKLTPPVEVLRNSRTIADNGEEWADKRFTVITILGTNQFNSVSSNNGNNKRVCNIRRAFRFCLDLFGSPALFTTDLSNGSGNDNSVEQEAESCFIDGFYNVDESLLFLHLNDAFDDKLLIEACADLDSILLEEEFVPAYNSFRSKCCQSLLLLFSLSHFVILSSPLAHFDTRFIHLFKTVDSVRIKTRPFISKLLNGLKLPKQWVEHGRLCSPKVLFLFEIESDSFKPGSENPSTEEFKQWLNSKKRTLEDEIYTLLRKCRIITDNCANSLFEIPDSPDFVFLYDKCTPDSGCDNSNIATLSNYIQQFCNSLAEMKKPSSAGAQAALSSTTSKLMLPRSAEYVLHQKDYRTIFHEFLTGNVSLVRKKMSETDSMISRRRNIEHKFFIQPTWTQWKSAFNSIFDYLILGNHSDPRAIEAYSGFEAFVNVDAEYLKAQCAKMFPKVFARYQKNIPDVYGEEEHQARLSQAINVYQSLTRGAAILPWLEKLTNKCEKFWKSGRQQCSAISLQEHCCVRPIHRVPQLCSLEIDPFPFVGDSDLPEVPHCSGITVKSACNCGRNQITRDEPFTIREANYSYYKRKEFECCNKLEEYPLSVYIPLQEDSEKQISLQEMLTIIQEKSKKRNSTTILGELGIESIEENYENEEEEDFDLNNPSQEFRRGNSLIDEEELEIEQAQGGKKNDGEAGKMSDMKEPLSQQDLPSELFPFESTERNEQQTTEVNVVEENESRETPTPEILDSSSNGYSRLEYLPGMLHSKSPVGLFPLFPSFSLLCLGSSSLYSHNSGVTHQSGFLSGYLHLLLPYDVKVKAEAGVSKPIPRIYRGTRLYSQMKRLSEEFTVKIFIGVEFECKKGHRFFLQAPDKILMIPNNVDRLPNLKEFASKIANSDIPLYYKCPCSNNGRAINVAQLMRIHIVTPKAPVHVSINPRIQPAPHAPTFSPGNPETIKLRPSSYWILRLPYCYVDNSKCYSPTNDPTTYNGRLMRGVYEVVAMSVKETKQWESETKHHEKS